MDKFQEAVVCIVFSGAMTAIIHEWYASKYQDLDSAEDVIVFLMNVVVWVTLGVLYSAISKILKRREDQ